MNSCNLSKFSLFVHLQNLFADSNILIFVNQINVLIKLIGKTVAHPATAMNVVIVFLFKKFPGLFIKWLVCVNG